MDESETQDYQKVLNLTRFEGEAIHLKGTLGRGLLELPECDQASDITIAFDVRRLLVGDAIEFHLDGEVTVEVSVSCVRCLAPVKLSLTGRIVRRFLPVSLKPEDDADHQILDGEANIEYYERPVFDLESLVREQIYLELPMDPHCRPDCSGLCPRCGQNRNLAVCDCSLEAPDPRFAVLGRLLPDA